MDAEAALRAGDLASCREDLTQRVRAAPADAKLRIFLFQLLCVEGEWARAANQLQVIRDLDASALAMVHTYAGALECEALRTTIFEGKTTPLVFGEPQRWVALLIEALKADAAGKPGDATALREEAFELAPARPGQVDGSDFAWLADSDPRFGPLLEAVISGRYYWLPLQHIKQIDIEEPNDLRDLVWAAAHLQLTNGGEAYALLPVRYPGTVETGDNALKLSRRTDWDTGEPLSSFGRGQRELGSDAAAFPLLSVRQIVFSDV